ncbi:DnaJ domain-containing protein [Vibrio parahaemolyticus]|nr:DnaJ domain-containing protein [Vibrio parahaemolyticus]HAS6966823.1 DnaJ domain-containing protein [Vibrio parahaemolyticus]
MRSFSRRRNEFKFHILRKESDYIAIYDSDGADVILDDLEEQGYFYLDWIRAKNSVIAVEKWQQTQREEVARLQHKNRELQETIDALEKEIEQLEKLSRNSPRSTRSNGLNDFSPYAILGVPEGCSDLQLIKKNYKRLSHIFHGDKSQSSETSDDMMKLINSAYEILKKK